MIHDGLAENGHYYVYVYEQKMDVWWRLDDHRVSVQDEETVFKEAFGGMGYKSACNLFYISSHITQIINNQITPVYNFERVNLFSIPKNLI